MIRRSGYGAFEQGERVVGLSEAAGRFRGAERQRARVEGTGNATRELPIGLELARVVAGHARISRSLTQDPDRLRRETARALHEIASALPGVALQSQAQRQASMRD